jgi:hypothetical protein
LKLNRQRTWMPAFAGMTNRRQNETFAPGNHRELQPIRASQ